jgi:hypothetical protein
MTITQESHDSAVLSIADNQVRLANVCSQLRRQGDPDAWKREEEGMMLLNILDSLRDYDITFDYLSHDEIEYMYELAIILIQR